MSTHNKLKKVMKIVYKKDPDLVGLCVFILTIVFSGLVISMFRQYGVALVISLFFLFPFGVLWYKINKAWGNVDE